ncbi:MAG: amino acid--tRNA ligase-related protein, partial [archaeon]
GVTQVIVNGKSPVKLEYCIEVEGKVAERKDKNPNMLTGEIEIVDAKVNVLSESKPLPFDPYNKTIDEDVRLKWRYLDLRRPEMQKKLYLRHKIIKKIHEVLDEEDFIELVTPMLTKSSPEGARDFIVPSRIHPGKFYALPQSPQQYKQLLMVAGFDKYYQIAPCFRDEDARADRSPGEFFQLDMEMSFVEQEDILDLTEKLMLKIVKEILPDKKLTFKKFPRLKYDDVMKKYGTDSPDLRKNKKDPNELAFAFIVDFPLFTPQTEEDFFHGAGQKWAPSHHMFTMPKEEHWKYLNDKEAHKAKAYQHDLVLNGFEVGGGSIRIHKAEIQEKIFDLIGFDKEDKKKFKHMLTAFEYGVPPHGGIAPGLDRLIMVLLGEPSLREVMPFPKNKQAKDLVMDAPSKIKPQQLKEANIKVDKKS